MFLVASLSHPTVILPAHQMVMEAGGEEVASRGFGSRSGRARLRSAWTRRAPNPTKLTGVRAHTHTQRSRGYFLQRLRPAASSGRALPECSLMAVAVGLVNYPGFSSRLGVRPSSGLSCSPRSPERHQSGFFKVSPGDRGRRPKGPA